MLSERQYGGFAIYLSSTIGVTFIILWTMAPQAIADSRALHEFFELLPQRYWILAIQCIILMTMLFTYVGLLAYNVDVLTVSLDDPRTVIDSKGRLIQYSTRRELEWYFNHETSGVVDLPINEVSRYLYLDKKMRAGNAHSI